MTQLSYSQKVARTFEVVSYLLLPFVILSLIFPTICVIGGLAKGDYATFAFGLIPILTAAAGLVLLAGYVKHSRGNLSERGSARLWIATIIYNAILLAPWLFYLFSNPGYAFNNAPLLWLFVTGYVLAIVFAVQAFRFERRMMPN